MQAFMAAERIGMPECGVIIAQAVAYLALAPKSTAVYKAYNKCVSAVKAEPNWAVPLHIRNAPTKLMSKLDYGKGYQCVHVR
jgi:putative ATPase